MTERPEASNTKAGQAGTAGANSAATSGTAAATPAADMGRFNMLDRLVGWMDPGAGLRRWQARRVLAQARAYEAANPGPHRKHHRDLGSPNTIVQGSAVQLRNQVRHLDRNDPLARGVLHTLVANTVGPNGIGVEPQPRRADGTIHEPYARALREAWRDWCLRPEVTQRHHWGRMNRLLARTWLRDGEAFAQMLVGRVPLLDHGTRVPFSLELFEADLVPFDYQELPRIHQGIERNAWGRPVAYHVYKQIPGDATAYLAGISEMKRIPADRVLHLACLDRIGQMRGVTPLASIVTTLADRKDYMESERIAAKVAAALTAYVRRGTAEDWRAPDAPGQPRQLSLSPGTILDNLAPGEEIGLIDSKRPNPNAITFSQGLLRDAAAGVAASYSSIARSYDGTFSAQRQELVEQWVHYACLTDEFVGQMVQPTWAMFVVAANLSGVVPAPRDVQPGTEDDALFIGQSMPWIDPLKEATAWVTLVKAGFASEVEVMRRRGVNPRDVLEQVDAWRRECADKGLKFDSDAALEHAVGAANAANADANTANEPAAPGAAS